ncbi:hypothetical protein COCNU_scaffold049394G000010 [Cocos nucifera]|nr:hypothetical protein [Cocos nucifera]
MKRRAQQTETKHDSPPKQLRAQGKPKWDLPIADALALGALLGRQTPAGSSNVTSTTTITVDRHLASFLIPRGGLEASINDEVPGSSLPHQEERLGEDDECDKHELE